ncbi:MAG: LapA family protein [Planctomycetota bacterium]
MAKLKLIVGGILLLLGIVLAVQNSAVVEITLLAWSTTMSQALLIFVTGAVGVIVGFLFGTTFRRARPK